MHIGSGTDLEHLSQVCGAMEQAALARRAVDRLDQRRRRAADPYRPHRVVRRSGGYFALWDATRKRLERAFGHAVPLGDRAGPIPVAESGYLVAEIRAVKRQDDNTFYLLDAGFNNLARPILYGAYHPMSIVPADGDTRRREQDVIVGGPLCESGDIFTQEEGGFVAPRRLPGPRSAICW